MISASGFMIAATVFPHIDRNAVFIHVGREAVRLSTIRAGEACRPGRIVIHQMVSVFMLHDFHLPYHLIHLDHLDQLVHLVHLVRLVQTVRHLRFQ